MALSTAVAVAFAFCTAAWIAASPGGRPVFRLFVHASLAALSGWIAWQYLAWSLALATTDLQVAIAELPDRFRHLVQLLRERYGVLPALVPIIAAWVCLSAAIFAAALVVDLLKRRAAKPPHARSGRAGLQQYGPGRPVATEPLWTARAAGAALRWGLIACPAAAGGAYFLLGPHPHDARLQAMLIAGGLSVVCWVVLVKPKGVGIGASSCWAFMRERPRSREKIFSSYLSWWLTQLPENPLRAAWSFPRLLSEHVDWLQARYGGLAGLSPFTSAGFSVLSASFAVDQAVRLLKGLGEAEAGRPRARSRLYGSARFMPNHHMRRLSREPGESSWAPRAGLPGAAWCPIRWPATRSHWHPRAPARPRPLRSTCCAREEPDSEGPRSLSTRGASSGALTAARRKAMGRRT